jgi:diguanylate cyclase (GGDEF)-like protein
MLRYGLAVLCFSALACLAQRYSYQQYTEGLGDLNVTSIAQDHTGFLWVGTENGLYRYDGHQFRRYDAADGLAAGTIRNLYIGPDGTLWVGAMNGIYFQRRDGSFAEVQFPASSGQFEQRTGTVFTSNAPDHVTVASRSGAFLLQRLEGERWIAKPMLLEGTEISSVFYGPDGALWYGCDNDLCRMVGGKTTHLRAAFGLPEQQWSQLLPGRNGSIWVRGSTHLGEVLPRENRFKLHDPPGKATPMGYGALVEDAQGRILATQGPAFGRWDGGHWRMVTASNGLERNDLSMLFVDREGSTWIAVVGHGLKRWLGQDHWEAYTVAEGLADNLVWSSLRDRRGRLWIATESGLDWIPKDGSAPRAWRQPGIETARAWSLAQSADGSIWLGSNPGSLLRIDPNTLLGTRWKMPEIRRILSVDSSGEHRLWVATSAGLYVVNTGAGPHTPQLVEDAAFANPVQRFRDLTLDLNGHLWAVSAKGIYLLDESGWHPIGPGRAPADIFSIAADRQGNLWAAGTFPGVARLRIAGYRVVDSEHIDRPAILSDDVVAIKVDHRGWLWIGQDAGVTVFDGRAWRSFTQDDGLIWNDCNTNALTEDPDGSMWIGTSGGLSHLMAPQTMAASAPLAPVFSQVRFGTRAIASGSRVPWSASSLGISIASLDFRAAHSIHIRYRLVGLNSEWAETGQPSLLFGQLAPGSYRLQAVALDASTGAVSPVRELSFTITPSWWQGWWIWVLAALLVLAVVLLLFRWRTRAYLRRTRELELAVERRTQDLEREKADLTLARDQMRHFAEHDDLTGLWNHRVIIKRLHQEVERAAREGTQLSVVLADLDHFKRINDTYGHPAGDLVLKEIGAIFMRSVRTYDWVGRYGGEEFLLIMPGSGCVSSRIRAEQLRAAVEAANIVDGETDIQVTASFGVACGYAAGFESLIRAADAALYDAKDGGRNCVMVMENISDQASAPKQEE